MSRAHVLALLDGWGVRAERQDNAIALAKTPIFDRLAATGHRTILGAAGEAVGLRPGQPGHAHAAHLSIGLGRPPIDHFNLVHAAMTGDGTEKLGQNPVLAAFVQRLRGVGGAVHLIGMVSPAGIHSHQHHMAVLAALLSHEGFQVHVHAIMDGEDTPPFSGVDHLAEFLDDIAGAEHAHLATITGRAFAMNRQGNWQAIAQAYLAIAEADGPRADHGPSRLDQAHQQNIADANLPPTILNNYRGIRQDDAVLFVNLRPDQIHRLAEALCTADFDAFDRPRALNLSTAASLTKLAGGLGEEVGALFSAPTFGPTLSQTIADAGQSQLYLAETANEAHLALFGRAGRQTPLPGEDIWLAQSSDAPFAKRPDMAAADITAQAVKAIKKQSHDVIIANFSNAAFVGHTSELVPTRKAVEHVDRCLGKLAAQAEKKGAVLMIAGTYGNAEHMVTDQGAPTGTNTNAHTPFILFDPAGEIAGLTVRPGVLSDVAPTLLHLLNIQVPGSMTAQSLLVPLDQTAHAQA